MDERAQGAVLVGLGGLSLRLAITGEALNFIQPSYVPLLAIAGALVLLMGAIGLYRVAWPGRQEAAVPPADHDHGLAAAHAHGQRHQRQGHVHDRAPRIAWFLALPIFAVLMIAPSPLGAFAASRQARVIVPPQVTAFPPLADPVDGAVEMRLGEYTARALYDPEEGLAEVPVRLTGFVSDVQADRWTLTRFTIACCAADGTPIDVEVLGGPPPPAVDQWVEVEGTWTPLPDHDPGTPTADAPLIEATDLTPIPQPEEPYET